MQREYPNKLDHVLNDADDVRSPRELHPIFYGSFDWHSNVHGYWLLATLRRRVPTLAGARANSRNCSTRNSLPTTSRPKLAYLAQPSRGTFERPYGWAWLLMLAAELARHDDADGRRWSAALVPLARAFADRFTAFLPKATYPIRVGTHFNSAFAVALALEYADAVNDRVLDAALRAKAAMLVWRRRRLPGVGAGR